MMFRVSYTRQAYVRTFMKDDLDHPDLRSHLPQRFAYQLHFTEPTIPFFRVPSQRTHRAGGVGK